MSIFAKVAYYNKKQRTRDRERKESKRGRYNKTARQCISKIKTIWKRAGNMHRII